MATTLVVGVSEGEGAESTPIGDGAAGATAEREADGVAGPVGVAGSAPTPPDAAAMVATTAGSASGAMPAPSEGGVG